MREEPITPKFMKCIYEDSDFWYNKGFELNKKNENESAVKCFFKALEL